MPSLRPLQDVLDVFRHETDPTVRAEMLIDFAKRFRDVAPTIATRPFSKEHLVPGCESEAYIFGESLHDGTLKFHFAVENPQGISAKGLAVILDESLSGAPIEEVRAVDPEIVYTIFGKSLSMGKGKGLMGMVNMIRSVAAAGNGSANHPSGSEQR